MSVGAILSQIAGNAVALLVAPGSHFSIWSLTSALVIAIIWLAARRAKRGLSVRAALRALFPKRWLFGRSARLDWMLLAINGALTPLVIGSAIISFGAAGRGFHAALLAMTGRAHLENLSAAWSMPLTTFIVFLAYELAYFTDHYLSHHIKCLWAFHKVHHAAETLSPATNYRVHPVDSLVFGNIAALYTGAAAGMCQWLFGSNGSMALIGSGNALLIGFVFMMLHLQHTQLWIAFSGWIGRWLLSPAHHQLHHSCDPNDFNTNFGNCLAVWDRLAGTLRMPGAKSPKLRFGVAGITHDPHTLTGALLHPFVDAWRALATPTLDTLPAISNKAN